MLATGMSNDDCLEKVMFALNRNPMRKRGQASSDVFHPSLTLRVTISVPRLRFGLLF